LCDWSLPIEKLEPATLARLTDGRKYRTHTSTSSHLMSQSLICASDGPLEFADRIEENHNDIFADWSNLQHKIYNFFIGQRIEKFCHQQATSGTKLLALFLMSLKHQRTTKLLEIRAL